jgi:ABC-type phosphate transport system substrate-binding protein
MRNWHSPFEHVLSGACLAGLFALACCLVNAQNAQTDDIAIVVNPKNPTVSLSTADLRKIFLGEKRLWPGDIPVKLIIRAPQARERDALLRLLRFKDDDHKRYWTTQAYAGNSSEPVAVFSNGMQKEAVIAIPGAIALIAVTDLKPGLTVLKIDDKLPAEPGYPLH